MKKMLQFILAFVIGLGMFIIPNGNVTTAQEIRTIKDNSIKIATRHGLSITWSSGFKFSDTGNGTVSPIALFDGKVVPISQIPDNVYLSSFVTVKFYDNNGDIYYSKEFRKGDKLKDFIRELTNVKMRYGLDSIQVISHVEDAIVSIDGTVYSNLDNQNFRTMGEFTARQYSFRVERDGLYAQYLNQVRIPDGEYTIEIGEDSYRVLDVPSGNNIGVSNHNINAPYQKLTLQYDNTNMAYKIKTNYGSNNLISWDSTHGNNVISYPDGNYADQFWYLERTNSGRYSLINAKNIYKVLNLDANNSNISVAERRNNIKQEFVFSKKSISTGRWKILTKTSNYHAVSIDIDGPDPRNVLPWVDRDTSQQKWIFEYDSIKGAYIIRNYYNNLVLAWDNNNNSKNVFVKPLTDRGQHYWILEDVGDGYYIFKNYSDQNMVLDLRNGNTGYLGNPGNIQVNERNNGNNQKFKVVR